jgi:hypothetical protein
VSTEYEKFVRQFSAELTKLGPDPTADQIIDLFAELRPDIYLQHSRIQLRAVVETIMERSRLNRPQ